MALSENAASLKNHVSYPMKRSPFHTYETLRRFYVIPSHIPFILVSYPFHTSFIPVSYVRVYIGSIIRNTTCFIPPVSYYETKGVS